MNRVGPIHPASEGGPVADEHGPHSVSTDSPAKYEYFYPGKGDSHITLYTYYTIITTGVYLPGWPLARHYFYMHYI